MNLLPNTAFDGFVFVFKPQFLQVQHNAMEFIIRFILLNSLFCHSDFVWHKKLHLIFALTTKCVASLRLINFRKHISLDCKFLLSQVI